MKMKHVKLFENFLNENEQIDVVYYHWGKYVEPDKFDKADLDGMVKLDVDVLEGFDIRPEDEGKVFYAYDRDIDDSGDGSDGVGVKNAYGVDTSGADASSKVYEIKKDGKWSKVRATSMSALSEWSKSNNVTDFRSCGMMSRSEIEASKSLEVVA